MIKTSRRSVFLPFFVLASLSSCKKVSPETKILTNHEPEVSRNTLGSCVFPQDPHFVSTNPAARKEIINKIESLPAANRFVSANPLRLPPQAFGDWVVYALTPLNMTCDTLHQKDIGVYGPEAYVGFVDTALKLYDHASVEKNLPFPNWNGFMHPFGNKKETFEVHLLAAINASITKNSQKKVRSNGEEVMHGIPLSPRELAVVHEIVKEGLIFITSYSKNEAFKNAYGDVVYGDFIQYPKGKDVAGLLRSFSKEYAAGLAAFRANPSQKPAFVATVAKLARKCVTIHPFADGNGRTCQLWALSALGRAGIPHATLWAGEDVLLPQEEYVARFSKAVSLHEELLRAAHTRMTYPRL